MKVITFASVKGGVGKSAAAIFTARAFAAQGARVALIDSDPSNSATDYFLREADPEEIVKRDLYLALTGRQKLSDCIISIAGISVVPATPTLANAGIELARDPGIVLRFPKAVRALTADVVVIDTPPSLSLELTLALHASDLAVVPVGLSRWTVLAFQVMSNMVQSVREAQGRAPDLLALPSICSPKEAETLGRLKRWKTTKTPILRSAAIRNALNSGKPLKPGSLNESWFSNLALELAQIPAEVTA